MWFTRTDGLTIASGLETQHTVLTGEEGQVTDREMLFE